MCCQKPGALQACLGVVGLLQVAVSIAILAATESTLVGPNGQCYLTDGHDQTLCQVVSILAIVSVFSSVVLSLFQGFMHSLFGCSFCLELPGRLLVALAWLGCAIATTVLGLQADHHDSSSATAAARHLVMGLAWAMVPLSLGLTAMSCAATCCASRHDLGRSALCCAGLGLCDSCLLGQRGDCCWACAELLCLGWLLAWWFGDDYETRRQGYHQVPSADPHNCPHHHEHEGPPALAPYKAPRGSGSSFSSYQHSVEHLQHVHVPVIVHHVPPPARMLPVAYPAPVVGGHGAASQQQHAPFPPAGLLAQRAPLHQQQQTQQLPTHPAMGYPAAGAASSSSPYPHVGAAQGTFGAMGSPLPPGPGTYPSLPYQVQDGGKACCEAPSAPPMRKG